MLNSVHKPKVTVKDISKSAINWTFIVMLLSVAILGGYSIYQADQLNQQTEDIYAHPFVVSNALRDISIQVLSMRSNMQDIPFANKKEMAEIIVSMQEKEQKALASFDIVLGAFLGDKSDIHKTRQLFLDWRGIRNSIILVAQHGDIEKAHAQTQGFGLKHVIQLRSQIQTHIDFANAKAQLFRKSSSDLESKSRITSIILSILIFILSFISLLFISRRYKKHESEIYEYIENIKQSEDKFRGILDAAPDAVLVVDKSRIINISNVGVEKIFGYPKHELVGQSVDILIPEKSRHLHDAHVSGYFDNPRSRFMNEGQRLMAIHKNGNLFPVTISLSPVTLDGETYVTCNIRDMSGYEVLEEKFRQAQKMEAVGTLVGGIAHDFNNILAAIIGAVFLAQRKPNDCESQLLRIQTQAERASEMVKQLLAFARKDIKKAETLSLNTLIQHSAKLFKLTTPEHIQFNIDLCRTELPIKGDETQLQQILLNLVNNARDALRDIENPVISISTKIKSPHIKSNHIHAVQSDHKYACISVSDNGHGIEEEYIDEIFEPFFTKKDVGEGTGLGLSMVKGTVESHDGFIEVESTVMEGTSFHVYFPLTDAHLSSGLDSDLKPDLDFTEGKGRCILLVDDEPVVREVNREILESFGYEVGEASDGLEAIEVFKKHQQHIHLIIMDVVMPKMNGIKAAEKIRQLSNAVPIIFATGYDRSQVLGEHEAEMENSSIMTKPFDVNALHKLIDELI